jgi:hypothetical protein|tara:strand:- start:124 stop:294 length:171 start_codon:yes stop_codon:yes gene_type:complete
MLTIAICLYLVGMLLVLTIFDIEEGNSPVGLLMAAVFWPLMTLHLVYMDLVYKDEE